MPEKVVSHEEYAGEYAQEWRAAAATGQCPFCDRERQARALYKCDGWFLEHNPFPTKDREGGRPEYHFLIICEEHREDISQLSGRDNDAINELLSACQADFGFTGGGRCGRFGDSQRSGATVLHGHIHIIVPRLRVDGTAIPVDFPVG